DDVNVERLTCFLCENAKLNLVLDAQGQQFRHRERVGQFVGQSRWITAVGAHRRRRVHRMPPIRRDIATMMMLPPATAARITMTSPNATRVEPCRKSWALRRKGLPLFVGFIGCL